MSKFFYLGANIHPEALDLIRQASDAIVLFEREDTLSIMEPLGQLEHAGRAYSVDRDAVESSRCRYREISIDLREKVVRDVLSDFKVFLLRMRFLRVDYQGAYVGFSYFVDIIDYAMTLADGRQPEAVFCAYTPHTLEAWVIVRTLEELGARVVRLIPSPLPWVYLPVQGLQNRTGSVLSAMPRHQVNSLAINKYLDNLRGDYSAAMPYYEKLENRFSPASFLQMLMELHPRNIAKQIEKWLVWRDFQQATSPLPVQQSFGVYFLHYQPEMNTLPEADQYCDQFNAVIKLAAALPKGLKLVIREHPSTFSKRCDRRWRPAGFYSRFMTLPNVQICPAEISAFELIDRSIFVASIAGVCLTEALARGKPAVAFYSPRFDCFSDGLVIDANRLLESELKSILFDLNNGNENQVNIDDLVKSLIETANRGYDGSACNLDIPKSKYEQNKLFHSISLAYLSDAISNWFFSNEINA